MKKLLSLFILILSPMLTSANTVKLDDIYYDLSSYNMTAEVTRNPNKYSGDVDIPATVVYNDITYDVTSIGKEAFLDCWNLTSVTIPNSVIAILDQAFTGCRSLTAVTIPNSVKYINWGAFYDCTNLASINISSSITTISSNAFELCRGLTSIIIPNSVTSIGAWSFKDCSSLTTFTIGSGIETINEYAFYACSKLTDVYCHAKNVPNTNEHAFNDVNISKVTLHVPAASIDAYRNVSPWNEFGDIVPIETQEAYRPMIEEGKTWNVVTINPADPTEIEPANFYDILGRKGRVWTRISYVIDGDTVISEVTYKKLLSNGNFVCGMREENGRVYGCGWSWAPSSDQLLYDFNAQPGDVFKSADGLGKIQVKHVREVDINGQSRRCLEMHHYDVDEEGKEYYGGFADYWIEGIGCTGYPHNPFWWKVIGNYPLLLSCYENGECIFRADDFNATIPDVNPDAPKYFPTGMTWEEIVVNPDMELEDDNACIYEIATDTIIGNITYKKVLRNNAFSGLCVRESGDKVWLLAKEYPTEILLYNFDWDSNPEIVTEYLKRQDEEDEDYEVRQETIPVGDSQTVGIEGKTYQYYMKRLSGTLIRGIGKVAELNRYPCLLSYREPAVILPGLDYHKVHWIKRNGVEIFRSESAKEWTEEIMDNYHPFIEDGKVWTYQYYNDFTGKEFYESLTVSGDTIINNKSYKKIVDVATGRVYCALREEERKVYANYPNYSGENLIYDFGLNLGDTFPLYEGSDPWATVVSVDTIVVGNRSFRALDVRPNDAKGWPNWWVEGIGGMYHLASNFLQVGNFYYFSSCQLDGDTLFTSHDFQTLGTIPSIETQTSMLCDGRCWKYEYSKIDWQSLTEEQILNGDYLNMERVTYSYWLRVEGDEMFDGRQCKKIVYDGFNGTGLYGYGYEEDGRVMVYALLNEPAFYAPFPTEQWVMLYDFNAAKDSHCDMGAFESRDLIVSVEGTLKVGDTDKRYIGLSDAQHPAWPLRYAVDGIGCPSGLYEFENIITDGSSSRFVGCYDGDVCIFSAEDFNTLSMSISVVQMVTGNNEVHDLQGRRLQGKPQKGVYIQDGKKYLVK